MTSELESTFAGLWVAYYPDIDLHSEYRFASPRRFRFDFAHLPSKIAIELQGGIFSVNTRHINGAALLKEHEKLNLAASLGWRVFYISTKTVEDEAIYEQIATAIRQSLSEKT
jgi:very-short-patch-repair endonuclease